MFQPHPIDALLAAALPAGSVFAVGGRVRDELRSEVDGADVTTVDLDYVVVGVDEQALRAVLATLGPVDVVGSVFSVFKVRIDGQTIDVALPRRERSTGVGHREFEVQSGPAIPLVDDLARRDFRMNMVARALPTGELVDPYGGEADIRARRIDILAEQTFADDPLRMFRAAGFAARFAYTITERTKRGIVASASLAPTVSAQRVRDELVKLLVLAPKPSIGLELLRETGLMEFVWPELLEGLGVEQNEYHAFDVWGHAMASVDATPQGNLALRLAALLHDVGKPRTKEGPHFYRHEHVGAEMVRPMLERFAFAGDLIDDVCSVIRQHMYSNNPSQGDAAVRRFIRRVSPDLLGLQFSLRRADVVGSGLPERGDWNARFETRVATELERHHALGIADLVISGSDVIALMVERGVVPPGFSGDRRVGAALRWLLEQVTDAPERNETAALRALLSLYFDAAPTAPSSPSGV
ncbi:MAG: HD domain-containing protein [Vulcanimicrobiaceae bacterium]